MKWIFILFRDRNDLSILPARGRVGIQQSLIRVDRKGQVAADNFFRTMVWILSRLVDFLLLLCLVDILTDLGLTKLMSETEPKRLVGRSGFWKRPV